MVNRIKNSFSPTLNVWFKESDVKKIQMMDSWETLHIVSTVCPDYANNGQIYTFSGPLGSGISLTALEHLTHVPMLLEALKDQGFRVEWTILVADLPELVESERRFYERVAGSREEFLSRCARSVLAIQERALGLAWVYTFSDFYSDQGLDYLEVQAQVAKKIQEEGKKPYFHSRFWSFSMGRSELAMKFRGLRSISIEETLEAGAHGMSLYITHGTLLRKIFLGKNLVVINHQTPNLQNFYLCNFVSGYEHLLNTPKFPLGILKKELY